MNVVTVVGGPVMTNSFIITDTANNAVVVDPGFDPHAIDRAVRQRGLTVGLVVTTHGHFDHVAGNRLAKELWHAPLAMHPDTVEIATTCSEHARWFGLECENSPQPDRLLAHGELIQIGDLSLEVRHVPGHCPGSIALVGDDGVIVGDVLFAGSIGRIDLPHSDAGALMLSIREQLMTLPDDYIVYSGHGEITTIGDERTTNPFRTEWERWE